MDRVWGTLFDTTTGSVVWTRSGGQWVLQAWNLPEMTPKGQDIIDATMTMLHNGMVFLAQISTLLPANALT
jgi:hypothetical protein